MDAETSLSKPGSTSERLLRTSEYFLRYRNLDSCRKHALRAHQSNPDLPGIAQILAIADVLTASETTRITDSKPDWYAILQVNRYSQDSILIKQKFNQLLLLLNPDKNKFAFADQAFDLVRDAWSVLSDPTKKLGFDNELKVFESKSSVGYEDFKEKCDLTFWTVCPYCYYVYEYASVYEECCLRCQNEKCGRGFQGVAILSRPPLEVVGSGKYLCMGFLPLGFEGDGGKGVSSWTPFVPAVMGSSSKVEVEEEEKNEVAEGNNVGDRDGFIEISDDSDHSCKEFESKDGGTSMDANAMKVEIEEVKQRGDSMHGHVGSVQADVPAMKKKKKSVLKNTKKLMGKGTRIEKHEAVPQSDEGLELNLEASADDKESGSADDSVMSGVEFFDGVDDIFVGLENGF